MGSKILRILALMMTVMALLFASAIKSYCDSVEATIEYKYDGVGNVIEKKVTYSTAPGQTDTNPPITMGRNKGDVVD